MNLLIIGTKTHLEEARHKFGEAHHYMLASYATAATLLDKCDVVFDFIIDENPAAINIYENHSPTIFLNTVFVSLSQLKAPTGIFGFCGLPTFFDRELLEVSLSKETDRDALGKICNKLNTNYEVVADRVGLVTPRIVCMIINEAYCTLEEGTATREDIDLAMKLGTNYPYGPFEWCERIGRPMVVHLLESVFNDTQDVRYKTCRLLRG